MIPATRTETLRAARTRHAAARRVYDNAEQNRNRLGTEAAGRRFTSAARNLLDANRQYQAALALPADQFCHI